VQIARKLTLSCIVEPQMTKIVRVTPIMTWTHGEIQHEMPHGIGITGNFQTTSESKTTVPEYPGRASETSKTKAERTYNGSWEASWETQNRSKICPWTSSGHPRGPRDVPAAPWSIPGSPPARPKSHAGAARDTPGCQKERPRAPGIAPEPPKLTPSRVWERKKRDFFTQPTRRPRSERNVVISRGFSTCSRNMRIL